MVVELQFAENNSYLDSTIVPYPFRQNVYEDARKGKFKIGYFDSLPQLPSAPASKRAVKMAREALEARGF